MKLPKQLQDKIDEALSLIEKAVQERVKNKDTFEDLDRLKKELTEMKSGVRKAPSAELSRMVIDCMDWELPYMQKYFEVSDLVSRHFGAHRK